MGWQASPRAAALATFGLGLLLSAAATAWLARDNTATAHRRFEAMAHRVAERVSERLHTYEYGLKAARGAVIVAGTDHITRERYRLYSASRDLAREFPGVHGIGIVRRVAPADEARFLAAARRDGQPDFALRQLTPHDGDRYVIQYIEPAAANAAALGLDVASEPHRRAAAEQAMRNNQATITAPITLRQVAHLPDHAFLLMLPIYAQGLALDTVAQREAATFGWAYAALVIDEVMVGTDLADGRLELALHDSTDGRVGPPFFATARTQRPAANGMALRVSMPLYGRLWEAEVRATVLFVDGLNQLDPAAVASSLVALSALLAGLAFMLAQNARRDRLLATEQARRAAIIQTTGDAIIGESLDGLVTDWNPGAERLFGHPADAALGQPLAALLLPPDRLAEDARIRATVARGLAVPPFDSVRLASDGRLLDVSIAASPIVGPEGQVVGLAKIVRDISEARLAERQLRELNATLEAQVVERTAMVAAAHRDLKTIVDAIPSLVAYCDRHMVNRFSNLASRQWFGIEPQDMPGRHVRDLVGPAQFAEILPHLEAVLRGEPQTFERTLPNPQGGTRQALTLYMPDQVGSEVRGFYVLVHDITEQTRDKARLAAVQRENEALLSTIRLHAIFSVADRSGRIIDANENFCRITGYSREELLGRNHNIVNSRVQDKAFWSSMWRTIRAGQPWRGEICNRAKDGSLYWVDSIIAPFLGEDGQIEKYISIRTDTTATKLSEQRLRESQAFLERAERVAGVGAWEFDIERRRIVWSAQMNALYELPPDHAPSLEDGLGRVQPQSQRLIRHAIKRAQRDGSGWDLELAVTTVTNRPIWVRCVGEALREQGRVVRLVGSMQDITLRKQAEADLSQTMSLLRSVMDSASEVSLIATDPALTITVFNRGAERMLGYTQGEVVGRSPITLLHEPDELLHRQQELSRALAREVAIDQVLIEPMTLRKPREWTYRAKDGRRIGVSLVVTAMHGDDGALLGYLGVAHDVTRQRQHEDSLREARRKAEEANLAKSQFLANVSHEIRTPMNAVVGLTYLLGQTPLDTEQTAFLNKMALASKSLLAVINDVLDLAKIEAGELVLEHQPFHLRGMLQELADVMTVHADAKRITFSMDTSDELPDHLLGDVTRLNQVLGNLLSNAIKFTDQGGVRLVVQTVAPTAERVRLRFTVLDTGIGIAPALQPQVFTPFTQADASTTRRFGGTGLGLSIVKYLVERLGGQVGLRSAVGRGSEFWVVLDFERAPAGVGAPPEPTTDPGASGAGLAGMRVLVVDDSEINLEVARRMLALQGAQVALADNGERAIDHLRAHPGQVDAVLMDVQMPVLDGHEATRRIRSELGLSTLPVIALTAGALTEERQRALAAGMDDFITKPFDMQAVVRCLRRLVGRVPLALPPPATHRSAEPEPQAQTPWPEIDGIEALEVRERLCGSLHLFESLLRRFTGEFACAPTPGPAPLDAAGLAAQASRMHRLRGSAGVLGARAIHRLAAQAEAAFSAGNEALGRQLLDTLDTPLRALQRSAAAALGTLATGRPPVPLLTGTMAEPTAADAAAVAPLVALLRQHNLGALAVFGQLSGALQLRLGEAAWARLNRQMAQLQFDEAAQSLSEALAAPDGPAAPRPEAALALDAPPGA